MNLIGVVNAGYKIIKQGKKSVIGESLPGGICKTYVAWSYSVNNDIPEFYWGRYSQSEKNVQIAFNKKEKGVYSG